MNFSDDSLKLKAKIKNLISFPLNILIFVIISGIMCCHIITTDKAFVENRNINPPQEKINRKINELNKYHGEIRRKFRISDTLISALKNRPPKSAWIESEKGFYKNLLKKSDYDILVVPFQTQDHGVDSIGRMFMSYLLAMAIEQNSNLKLAPLSLVYPALGHPARYYEENDVKSLAKELGVSRIIWSFAGTHSKRAKRTHNDLSKIEKICLNFSIVDQRINRSEKELIAKCNKWLDQSITPEVLPYKIFENKLNEVMEFLGFEYKRKKTINFLQTKKSYYLPDTPSEVFNIDAKERVYRSYILQCLAMLAPTDYHKNHLFAQSVINMFPVESENIDRRLIESRAYIHLYRRPAAIKAIEGLQSIEAKSLRNYINANLPELKHSVAKLPSSIKKLLAELELFSLREEYADYLTSKEREIFLSKFPNWQYLMRIRLNHYRAATRFSNIELKLLLDQILPVHGFSAKDLALGHTLANSNNENALKAELLFKKHIKLYLKKYRNQLTLCKNNEIDLILSTLTLMESVGIFNLTQEVDYWSEVKEIPEKGLEIAEEILNEYNGHPYFVIEKAMVMRQMMKRRNQTSKKAIQEKAFYLSLDAMWWNGSQNWVHHRASKYLFPVPDLRELYISPNHLLKGIGSDYPFRVNVAMFNNHRPLESLLPWAHTDMKYHRIAYQANHLNANYTSQVISDLNGRFNGNINKKRFFIKNKISIDRKASEIEILTKEIESGNDDWELYNKLSKLYINKGDYKKAKDVLMKYSAFKSPRKYSSVEVSKAANRAANSFYWHGAIEQARIFYELGANLDTGCNTCLKNKERLHLIDGDYYGALSTSKERGKQYNSPSGYNNFMTYLHLVGEHEMAWSLFKNLLGRYRTPHIWDSAFIGKRLQKTDPSALSQWVCQISDMEPSIQRKQFALRFMLMNLIDRDPDMKMVEIIKTLEKNSEKKPSNVKVYIRKKGNNEENVEPPMYYSLFANAYENIKLQNYKIAYRDLKEINGYYGFGSTIKEKHYRSYLIWAGLKGGFKKESAQWIRIFLIKSGARGFKNNAPNYISGLYNSIPTRREKDINLELSLSAYFGATGKYDEAYNHLNYAFNALAESDLRPIFSLHQVFEFCEWIYNDSGDVRFIEMALQRSKKLQKVQPMLAELYSIEAKYSKNYDDIVRAVAIAQYLDCKSAKLNEIDEKIKKESAQWMKKNNPFKIRKPNKGNTFKI